MDRLFLDANILFSAAYREDSGLRKLWKLKRVELLTSRYAFEEARSNLENESQRDDLRLLCAAMQFRDAGLRAVPKNISLPEKDIPILMAAIESGSTHLITGDIRHFGPYFGKEIEGVLVISPAEYMKNRK